ncbi:sensor histidine kinase [Nonomuraea rhodomycinica]|uniref:histidine kinase n=1 Tax=Nonomuraea rhodomycinica TaxID=1712872 RepID=A0A7Y6MD30_9ACTN|nr:histidine kinase [Nonomuraea rhodomycinica]NUW43427.1 two-component sensor histidine kinase [Nonomuraea rhodomycinica]
MRPVSERCPGGHEMPIGRSWPLAQAVTVPFGRGAAPPGVRIVGVVGVGERMRWSGIGAVVLAAACGVPRYGVAAMAPLAAAVAALVWALTPRPGGGRPPRAGGTTGSPGTARLSGLRLLRGEEAGLPAVTAGAAAVSLAATLVQLTGRGAGRGADVWGMAEGLALIALAGLLARRSPARRAVAAGVPAGIAASTWMFRFYPPVSALEAVGICAFWSAGVLCAVGVGLYLRTLDERRAAAVAAARAAQRRRLARDLHDFVAHDVSEMLAQAQAGQVAGVADPAQAMLALRRVEEAGLRAMATLDRTVLHLNDEEGESGEDRDDEQEALAARLSDMATRYSSAGPARVHLSVDDSLDVPGRVSAAAYRVVAEALTNVRRHAPGAARVEISATTRAGALQVTVENDGVTCGGTSGGRGGFGLPGLAEHVASLGGDLSAGPVPGGWRLSARIPLARRVLTP